MPETQLAQLREEREAWLERDADGGFPEEFYRAMAEGGWLGIGFPEELGGSGLGVRECAIVMRRISNR